MSDQDYGAAAAEYMANDPLLQAAVDDEIAQNVVSTGDLLAEIAKNTKEQAELARRAQPRIAALNTNEKMVRSVVMQMTASPEELHRTPSLATWSPTDRNALYPANMSEEDRKKMFPNGSALVESVTIHHVKNTYPFAVALDFAGLADEKHVTAGNGTSHHYIIPANFQSDAPMPLSGFDTAEAQRLMERYPGFTPENLASNGVMTDPGKPGFVRLSAQSPVLGSIASALMEMGEEGALEAATLLDAASHPSGYVDLSADAFAPGLAHTQKLYGATFKRIDLGTFCNVKISRPGLPFNSKEEVVATREDYLLAALNMQPAMLSREVKTAASVNGNGSSSTLMAHLAKGKPGMSASSTNLSAAAAADDALTAVEAQTASTLSSILNKRHFLTLTAEIVYRPMKGN